MSISVSCVRCEIDNADKYLYVGTTSGDVIIVNIPMQKLRGTLPPVKKRFNMGVTAIGQFKSGEFIVGAGDGLVCLCDPQFNRTEYVPYTGYRLALCCTVTAIDVVLPVHCLTVTTASFVWRTLCTLEVVHCDISFSG